MNQEGGPQAHASIRLALGQVRHEKAGLFRDARGLGKAAAEVAQLLERYRGLGIQNSEGGFWPRGCSLLPEQHGEINVRTEPLLIVA